VCASFPISDINPATLGTTETELKERHPGIEVLSLETDTSNEASVNSAITKTVSAFSRLDFAVNNAGISCEPLPSHKASLTDWQRVMSINLDGVWLCQRAQVRQMLSQPRLEPGPRGNRGVIVNVSSMLGLVASSAATPACSYTASKHGVVGLTKADAVAYAKEGIRINAVCAGYIRTPLLEAAAVSYVSVTGSKRGR
jgi:NAD(P)-dependent dehydrogenase (short-subunit alcohol dehydrogenase family)